MPKEAEEELEYLDEEGDDEDEEEEQVVDDEEAEEEDEAEQPKRVWRPGVDEAWCARVWGPVATQHSRGPSSGSPIALSCVCPGV